MAEAMTRAYLRLDPQLVERKEGYPDGPYRAFVDALCLAEAQPERGRFRSLDYLRRLLGRAGRHVGWLLDHADIVTLPDGRVYVTGWDEWQEGDWTVKERMDKVRTRRGDASHQRSAERSPGAHRTARWRLRTQVFARDSYICRYCLVADHERSWLVIDHVDPNGPTDLANLVTACRPCNKRKGGRTPLEAGMILHPAPPRETSHTVIGTASPNSVTPACDTVRPSELSGAELSGAERCDVLDAYYRLTASWPSPRVVPWLNELSTRHGDAAVSTALAAEWIVEPATRTLLSRTRDRLEREAHEAAQRRAEAQRRTEAAEQARIAAMPLEQRQANLRRLREMARASGLELGGDRT